MLRCLKIKQHTCTWVFGFPVTWSPACARCLNSKSPALVLSPSHLRSQCTLAGIQSRPPPTGTRGCLWTGTKWRDRRPRPETPASSPCRSPAAWRGSSRWPCSKASPASPPIRWLWPSVACKNKESGRIITFFFY